MPIQKICLTNKRTRKVIIDYTSDVKELLAYKFEIPKGQAQYKKIMAMVEPRFSYNKYTLKYRQYHILGLNNAKCNKHSWPQHKT